MKTLFLSEIKRSIQKACGTSIAFTGMSSSGNGFSAFAVNPANGVIVFISTATDKADNFHCHYAKSEHDYSNRHSCCEKGVDAYVTRICSMLSNRHAYCREIAR